MSRSYKKAWLTDGGSSRRTFFKNYANRVLRRKSVNFDITDGNVYKKHFDQYSICDYRCRYNSTPWVDYNYKTCRLEWVMPDPLYKYNRK